MATVNPQQIHPDSVDAQGLSVVTSPYDESDNRYGMAYNPSTLIGMVPVHFHPIAGAKYLVLMRTRWYGATATTEDNNLGYYPDEEFSVSSVPSWGYITANIGTVTGISEIPMKTPYTTRILESAASRNDLVWLLNTVTFGGIDFAVVQAFRRDQNDEFCPYAEETLPTFGDVLFNRGVYFEAPHLYFYGSDSATGEVYLVRKQWAQIGHTTADAPWEFQTARGWSTDPDEAVALLDEVGNITTVGPISTAIHRGRKYSSVVFEDGGEYFAQVYLSKGMLTPWRPVGQPVELGDSTSYQGGTLYLQGHIDAYASNPVLEDPSVSAAIPAVKSVAAAIELPLPEPGEPPEEPEEEEEPEPPVERALLTTWTAWPVSRTA